METLQAWLMSIDAAVPGGAARVLSAIVLFLCAWILAKAGTALFSRAMRRLDVSRRISDQTGLEAQRIQKTLEQIVYYAMFVGLGVVILDFVNLAPVASAATTLIAGVLSNLPGVVTAFGIMLVAWIFARIARAATRKVFETAAIEAKIAKISGEHASKTELAKKHERTTQTAGEIVYCSFMVLGAIPALGAMGLARFSTPLAAISETVLAFIPRLVAAVAMLIAGWFLARIVRNGTTTLLASTEIDGAAERIGFANVIRGKAASTVIGSLLYWVIMLSVTIASIDALQVSGISTSLNGVLNGVFAQVPNVLVALGVLLVSIVLGRWVGDLLRGFAETLGADSILARIGFRADQAEGRATPSQTIGKIGQGLVVLFGTTQGLKMLGLVALGGLLDRFLAFVPSIALALAITAFGFIVGNWVKGWIQDQGARAENELLPRFFGSSAKLVIVTLSLMAACLQVGLERQLVLSGFAILFGAAVFAMALAFGLGARETAGELAAEVLGRVRGTRSAEAGRSTDTKLRRAG